MSHLKDFLSDLEKVSRAAASELSKGVNLNPKKSAKYDYEGQRDEAQFVAEIYHRLILLGYNNLDLFMEYCWVKNPRDAKQYKLKADLFFQEKDDVKGSIIEIKTFLDGGIKVKNLTAKQHVKNSVIKDYDKLLEYSSYTEIKELALVVGYLGPTQWHDKKWFFPDIIEKSIWECLSRHNFKGRRGQEIRLIVV